MGLSNPFRCVTRDECVRAAMGVLGVLEVHIEEGPYRVTVCVRVEPKHDPHVVKTWLQERFKGNTPVFVKFDFQVLGTGDGPYR